jgi:hypothetical protein
MAHSARTCLMTLAILGACMAFGQAPANPDDDTGGPPNLSADQARYIGIMTNLERVDIQVTTDRDLYFPGETIKMTLKITNPTAAPLEIPDPNDPKAQGFRRINSIPSDVRSVVLQPGQTVTLTVDSEGNGAGPPWWLKEAACAPGKERLQPLLGGSVTFQIGAPVLEASAMVPLGLFKTSQDEGMDQPETSQYGVMIVAVQMNGEHLILAALHNLRTDYRIETNKDGTLSDRAAIAGAPWVRLATVPAKVTKLTGTADPSGQITLDHTTEDGGGGKIYLDKSRHPL